MILDELFTADTTNPNTEETTNKVFGRLKDGREFRVLHTLDELIELKETQGVAKCSQMQFALVDGEYGMYLRASNKKNVAKIED
jgi:hypothetical protein